MDSIFKIQKYNKDEFLVIGLEKDNGEYLSETSGIFDSFRQYTFSQSVTLNLVSTLSYDLQETLVDHQYVQHIDVDQCSFKFKVDSLYQVDHIILPTREWYNYLLSLESSTLSRYDRIIYYNIETNNLIEIVNGLEILIDIMTLQEYYRTDLENSKSNTIILGSKYTISIAKMKDTYTKVSEKLLSSTGSCVNNATYQALKQKRDILMMAIDTINYSIELFRYFDAQRIIEVSNRCGWLYNDDKMSHCGCN